MRHEGYRGHHNHHEGRNHRNRGESFEARVEGAKTFRRKRAIMFLEHLETKQKALKKQLETPELQTAHPIIVGELKATQAIIEEFVQQFELYEFEEYAKLRNKEYTESLDEE
ncbi:hypothetical protein ACOQFO_05075 [Ureibacillus sp. MALMAid1270]|uniref:hypothetical protein n=1 Tax=Ureibacillus sp. MALMAid1270 TaxID=3411629 RepID=UPI003BA51542